MKKNKMMRIASVLLIAVLISTCAISGTFAKYVTKAKGEDSARVAKWGVLVTLDGEAFLTEYEKDDDTYKPAYANTDSTVTVQTSAEDKLVAPGTKNEGLVATLTGTPEVAVRYSLTLSNIVVPVLKAGEDYVDYTQLVPKTEVSVDENTRAEATEEGTTDEPALGYYGTFGLEEDYYPVVFTLSINGTKIEFNTIKDFAEIFTENATIGDYVTAEFDDEEDPTSVTLSVDFSPNTELPNGEAKFGLSWEWAFEQENVELYDKADTYLGNVAAGVVVDEDAVTTVSFNFAASATQID